jgi:hypothetical protein
MSPKFKVLILALALATTVSTSFANPKSTRSDDPNSSVKASFKKDFKTATILSVDNTNQFTKVTFTMNGNVLFAFYTGGGDLMAVTRNILSSQLPMNLINSLKTKYGDYWITDLFEIDAEAGNYYYITLENADRRIVLRSIGLDSWETFDIEHKKETL